jgi:general secretion pathway protein K
VKIRTQKTSSGIALIIVMLVILVLATLAGGFAYSMKVETVLARNANHEAEFEWLGRSGVELARYVISQKCPGQDNVEALNQKWAGGISGCSNDSSGISLENIQLGAGIITKVTITDLERKVNINMMNKDFLERALVVLMGVDASLVPTISDSILDWKDRDDDNLLSGAESDYYLGLDPPYLPKNGDFDDISELLLVKGISENPEIYWGSASTNHSASAFQSRSSGNRPFNDTQQPSYPVGLVDIFTTFSSGKVNINTASATTLKMIPGVDEDIAIKIIQQRAGPDGVDGTEDDTPFQGNDSIDGAPPEIANSIKKYGAGRSSTFEVQIAVELGGMARNYFAVIRKGNKQGEFAILKFYWNQNL